MEHQDENAREDVTLAYCDKALHVAERQAGAMPALASKQLRQLRTRIETLQDTRDLPTSMRERLTDLYNRIQWTLARIRHHHDA